MLDRDSLLTRCTFPPSGARLDCAVSGGADSLALLVLATWAGCRVTAIQVDHGLRPGSASEAEVVAGAAERFGATFSSVRADVLPGPNLEARARQARRSVLPVEAATGHTADDQAETVLLNLLRGSGSAGLAGMRVGPRHPILGLRRHETHKIVAELGLTPVQDPTNHDLSIRRNHVRHRLVPLLDEIAGRDVSRLLARQAGLLAEEVDFVDGLSEAIEATDASELRAAPAVLARRAIRQWLRPALGGYPPDSSAVDRVLDVAHGRCAATDISAGVSVSLVGDTMAIHTGSSPPSSNRGGGAN